MLKKLIAGLSLSVMMVGCNSVNISEKDVNGYLGKHAPNSFNLSYVLLPNSKVDAVMTINSLKASINDDQFVVSMKGTTKGKNADYTVNTTFTAEAKGFISVNYGEGAVRLRSPIVTLKGAPEINTMIKDNYIKTTQSALEDVSDYIFSSTPMFALTKDQVNQIGLSDDSVIETLVDDGLISIRTMK